MVEKLGNLASLIKVTHFWQMQLCDTVYFSLKSKIFIFAKQLFTIGQTDLLERLASIIFRCFARRIFHQIAVAFDVTSLNGLLYGDVMFKWVFTQSQFKRISQS